MINNDVVNVSAFAANNLGEVARATTRGISVGVMVTQIAEHLGFEFNWDEDHLVEGMNKVDIDAFMHQG